MFISSLYSGHRGFGRTRTRTIAGGDTISASSRRSSSNGSNSSHGNNNNPPGSELVDCCCRARARGRKCDGKFRLMVNNFSTRRTDNTRVSSGALAEAGSRARTVE